MSFKYNPKIWTIKEVVEEYWQWLELNSDHGTIKLEYKFPVGMGGGLSFIKSNERVIVKNNLIRVTFDGQKYAYGLETEHSITLYENDADAKQYMLDACANPGSADFNFLNLDSTKCADIQSGNIIGQINTPSYPWSITLKRVASLDQFEQYSKEYYEGSDFDLNNIIIEVSYTGTNPEEADEIVMQFVP